MGEPYICHMTAHSPIPTQNAAFVTKNETKEFKWNTIFYTKYLSMLYIDDNYWQHPASVDEDTMAMMKHFTSNKFITWITHTVYILILTLTRA